VARIEGFARFASFTPELLAQGSLEVQKDASKSNLSENYRIAIRFRLATRRWCTGRVDWIDANTKNAFEARGDARTKVSWFQTRHTEQTQPAPQSAVMRVESLKSNARGGIDLHVLEEAMDRKPLRRSC